MRYWSILDSEGAPLVGRIDSETEPDPAVYGGTSAEELPAAYDPYDDDLAALTAQLLARIDEEAGAFRANFITTVPGQEMTYLDKEAQARAFIAGAPEDAWPLIAIEATARGLTHEAQAELVITQAEAWRQLGAAIEGRRMGAKIAVAAAGTAAAKRAAATIDWQSLLP